MPITVYVQTELLKELKGVIERPAGPRPIRFGGVAAFPSLHLAVITLFTLAVVTGYHYLLDGLAGMVIGAACYRMALTWAKHWLGSELEVDDGRPSSWEE
jgi:hypothetical protein